MILRYSVPFNFKHYRLMITVGGAFAKPPPYLRQKGEADESYANDRTHSGFKICVYLTVIGKFLIQKMQMFPVAYDFGISMLATPLCCPPVEVTSDN